MNKKTNTTSHSLNLIYYILSKMGVKFVFSILVSIISGLSSFMLIFLINHAITNADTSMKKLGIYFALACIIGLISHTMSGILFAQISQTTLSHIRTLFARKITQASYTNIEKHGAAKIQSIATEDATTISLFFVSLPSIIINGAIVLSCLAYLGYTSWNIFLFSCIALLIGSFGYHFGHIKAIEHIEKASKVQDVLFSQFGALCFGAKELKLNQKLSENFLTNIIGKSILIIQKNRTQGFSIYSLASGWALFSIYAFIGSVIFVFTALDMITLTTASGFAVIIIYMLSPLDTLLNNIPSINQARVSIARFENFIADLDQEKTVTIENQEEFCSLTLENITHQYYREQENQYFELGPINLQIKKGDIVFIIGGNGSGKTTLAKIILGLYPKKSGTYYLNQQEIKDHQLLELRQQFSAIFSDFYLFESIQNIDDSSKDIEANKLLEQFLLNHKVNVKNGKFSTKELSQGQKKRLALIAAYLENKSLFLFDEWAADQDPSFKKIFYRDILPSLKAQGKTVIAITHDDKYFDVADYCVKLDEGKISHITKRNDDLSLHQDRYN